MIGERTLRPFPFGDEHDQNKRGLVKVAPRKIDRSYFGNILRKYAPSRSRYVDFEDRSTVSDEGRISRVNRNTVSEDQVELIKSNLRRKIKSMELKRSKSLDLPRPFFIRRTITKSEINPELKKVQEKANTMKSLTSRLKELQKDTNLMKDYLSYSEMDYRTRIDNMKMVLEEFKAEIVGSYKELEKLKEEYKKECFDTGTLSDIIDRFGNHQGSEKENIKQIKTEIESCHQREERIRYKIKLKMDEVSVINQHNQLLETKLGEMARIISSIQEENELSSKNLHRLNVSVFEYEKRKMEAIDYMSGKQSPRSRKKALKSSSKKLSEVRRDILNLTSPSPFKSMRKSRSQNSNKLKYTLF